MSVYTKHIKHGNDAAGHKRGPQGLAAAAGQGGSLKTFAVPAGLGEAAAQRTFSNSKRVIGGIGSHMGQGGK